MTTFSETAAKTEAELIGSVQTHSFHMRGYKTGVSPIETVDTLFLSSNKERAIKLSKQREKVQEHTRLF